jgi:glycosyltransferase involved in cell wall biosynthesis
MNNRKRIVYLTSRNAKDKREWSGTLYYMAQSLSTHAGEVIHIGPYSPTILIFLLKAFRRIIKIFLRKNYNVLYNYLLSLAYKFHFTNKIKKLSPDVVFAASASVEMSQLKLDCPIIYLGDSTFSLLKDNYPTFSNLINFSVCECEIIERKTFRNASALVFSSEWAANSAEKDYSVPVGKIYIISYGANMDAIPTRQEAINKNIDHKIKLLFLGVDWIRKGGNLVYDSFIELQNSGINVELTVCGCIPPKGCKNDKMTVIPFLNKNNDNDFKILFNILKEANFLFVPSRSDCTPIAFCEANAFGVPVLSTDVGGITSVIKNEINGYVLPFEATPSEYTKIILMYYNKVLDYSKLVVSSRGYYEANLNWDQWGIALCKIITDLRVV